MIEEDTGRKAILENGLPLKLIELLKKPLPSYLEDMDDAGCFVDVDEPDGNGGYIPPQDTSSFQVGLTSKGYYTSGVHDVHGEEPHEDDYSFLEGKYAGETILLK